MTTEAQINEQIANDYKKFWNKPYEGKLPDEIMYKFREAIMFHNVISLEGRSPKVILKILETKEYDLNFFQVGIVINTILPVTFNCMYSSPEEAMMAAIELQEINVEYNKIVEIRKEEIERKRARLLQLSGITRDTVQMNGATLKPLK